MLAFRWTGGALQALQAIRRSADLLAPYPSTTLVCPRFCKPCVRYQASSTARPSIAPKPAPTRTTSSAPASTPTWRPSISIDHGCRVTAVEEGREPTLERAKVGFRRALGPPGAALT